MKKNVENNEDLLKQLALRGDPHAFFLLGESYFRARYRKERVGGATHQDAQIRILADAIELLEGLQRVAPNRFDAWFDEHCTMFAASAPEDKADTFTDKKIDAETGAFLNRCSRELLRTGSAIKKARLIRRRRLPHLLVRNKLLVGVWIVISMLAFIAAAGVLMAKLQTALVVSLDTPGGQFSVRFPPVSTEKERSEELLPVEPAAAAPSAPDSAKKAAASPAGAASSTESKTVPPSAEKRALPPVVPRARLTPPPAPPPVTEPDPSIAPVPDDQGAAQSSVIPSLPPPAPAEPAPSY